jgi:hypothetical protein
MVSRYVGAGSKAGGSFGLNGTAILRVVTLGGLGVNLSERAGREISAVLTVRLDHRLRLETLSFCLDLSLRDGKAVARRGPYPAF